jgi:hypothetical protein
LTNPTDGHAERVAEKLQERGADVIRFNPAQFPSEAAIAVEYTAVGQLRPSLRTGDRSIDLNDVRAVWYRRPDYPVPHSAIADTRTRTFVAEESQTFMSDLWNLLDCLWVPAPPVTEKRAQFKATQLRVAGTLGFELPPTLITNDPDEFLGFYLRHNGRIVSKLAGFAWHGRFDTEFVRYTEVVSKRDASYARSIRYCPIIFQAYVPKRLELRITVVGRRIFAAEIHSQASNHTRHDWRRYDSYKTVHMPHALPDELADRCVRLVERLGLCYGAIDMVLTPDGRYVFLEINPNGQYLWIEGATGLPISDAICDLLMSPSATEPAEQPTQQRVESYAGGPR